MDSEDAVMRDFLKGPLDLSGAVNRLIGMGYLRENAEDLVNEWADSMDPRHRWEGWPEPPPSLTSR